MTSQNIYLSSWDTLYNAVSDKSLFFLFETDKPLLYIWGLFGK
jgi:hypothetical protein